MGFNIGTIATEAATEAADSLLGQTMGLIFGGQQDKRQLRQQKKLQALQIKGQKELADYQQQQQMNMWNATNAEAQVKHYKDAGLNVGLMYEGGGAGGVTTGGGINTGVASANPTDPSAAIQASLGMGIQQAQIELMKSQAKNLDADTAKKSGVDTDKIKTEIESLSQGIQNQKAQETLLKTQNRLEELQEFRENETLDAAIARIKSETDYQTYKTRTALQEARESEATIKDKVSIVNSNAIGAIINNSLQRSNIDKVKSETILNRGSFKTQIKELMLKTNQMEQQGELTKEGLRLQLEKIDQDLALGVSDAALDAMLGILKSHKK